MAEPDFQPGFAFAPASSDSDDAGSEPALEYAAPLAIRKRRANRGRRLSVTAKRPRSSGGALSGSGVTARDGHGRADATEPTANGVISSETEGLPPSAASHTSDVPHTTASGDTGDRASPSSGPNSSSKFRATAGTTAATSPPADAQNRSRNSPDMEMMQRSRGGESSLEGIWQLLRARSRAIDHSPRPTDPRFVSRNRPLDEESGLKTSIAITLFPDGYARHDIAPGRPLVRKPKVESQLAENGTGVIKLPSFEDGETSLPIRSIAELPRFPYDRSSADLLQAIDLGLLPAEKDLPEISHRHFYDGCLIAVVHDARKLTLPLPSSPKAAAGAATPPSGASRQSKERGVSGKVNGQAAPAVVDTVANGGQSASLSSPSALMPSSSASSLYQPGVVTSRVRLRPDGYNKLEDIEKVTDRLARDEARAVEEAILRYTSAGLDCRPDAMKLKMPLSLNALYTPRPVSAPVILRGQASHTPSLSTAALMLVSTAEKQLQYARVRHMNNSVSGSRGPANATSTGAQSASEDGAAGMAKAKTAAQASGKLGSAEHVKPLNDEAVGRRTLDAESEDVSNAEEVDPRPRSSMPPYIIREPLVPSGGVAASAKAERIRHMTLLQKGGQHAKILQLQIAAASGTITSEAARQAQKSLSQGSNSGRPAYAIDVMKREKDRGYQVVISRGLPGERARDVLRFSLTSREESNAFVNQFRIVALAEGYFCQQDAKNVRPSGSANQQQSSGQPRPTDPQWAITNRQSQAVLQAARYQQQIAQSQQQLNPHQLAQQQHLAQQQFAQHQFNQQQQQLAAAQQRRRQEQQRQQHPSPAQTGAQRPHPTQLQTQQQQQQRLALQNQQKSSGSQPQAARQQQTSQQQQLLLNQQRQQQIQRQASVQQRQQQQQKLIAQHAPQHQQQFIAQMQQQSSPQQSSSLRTPGNNRQGGSVPSPSFTGLGNGGMPNTLGLSPGLQSSQQLQQNHANRAAAPGQDVMAFASQYAYQQKPPTISQQQHSLYLQQQIQNLAAQNKANLLRQSTTEPAPTATFTEDDLQPSKLPHQANNRKV